MPSLFIKHGINMFYRFFVVQFIVQSQKCLLLGSLMARRVCGMQRIKFFPFRVSETPYSTLSFLSDLVMNEKCGQAKKLAHNGPVCE